MLMVMLIVSDLCVQKLLIERLPIVTNFFSNSNVMQIQLDPFPRGTLTRRRRRSRTCHCANHLARMGDLCLLKLLDVLFLEIVRKHAEVADAGLEKQIESRAEENAKELKM